MLPLPRIEAPVVTRVTPKRRAALLAPASPAGVEPPTLSESLATALPAPQATRHAAAPTALRREDESAHFTRSPRFDTDLLSSWERSLVESASRSVASRERREPETTARTSAVGAASNTLFPSSAALIRRADEDPSFRSELLHKVSDGRAAAGHRHAPGRDVGGRDHRPGDLG